MGSLTLDALAIAAGTSRDVFARLSELGLLLPVDGDGLYPLSNVSRIRLLNMRAAKALGGKFPESILLRADRVIE